MLVLSWIAGLLVAGGTVFYGLSVLACRQWRRRPRPRAAAQPSISILKPLAGLDLGFEENVGSFFQLDYPNHELLLGVRNLDDPAAPVARRMVAQHPDRCARLVVAGEPPSLETYPNGKNWSLLRMAEQASGEILVISDSDIRSSPDDLQALADDFADEKVGVVTCPYRAVPGASLWSRLEAIGMNTEFWAGALTAQFLGPMDFAVGPTMALRRNCLDEIGGFEATRDAQAEDFLLGQLARQAGWEVALSSAVVEHHIGSQGLRDNWQHRLRWYRSTRRSRPWGYLLQVFTYPLPFALTLPWLSGGAIWAWALLGGCVLARIGAAAATAMALGDRLVLRNPHLLLLQDMLSFLVWLCAFWGNRTVWRGHVFSITSDGRIRVVEGYNRPDSSGGK